MIPLRYNVRSLAVRKATTFATAGGIALVVFVLSAALMLSAGIKKTLGSSGRADTAIVMRMGSDAEFGSVVDDASVPLILAAPGVKMEGVKPVAASEIVVVKAMEKLGANGVTNVTIRGVNEDVLHFRPEVHLIAGRFPNPGADEAMVGARIRGRIRGLELDQDFKIKKNRPVKVVGVFAAAGSAFESEVWVERELTRQAFGRQAVVSSVRVRLEAPTSFDAFRAAVENDQRLGLQAQRETTYYEKQSEGTVAFIAGMGTVISIFFAMGAMIGAMITMYAAVASRQREIGVLRALGFSRFSVLVSFVFEAVFLALAGGIVGAVASLGLGLVRLSMVNLASWSEVVFSFDPTPRTIVAALVFSCGMGLFGGLLPAFRAARVSPLKAIRD